MREVILDLKREGRTIFLTTHDMTVADQLCDRVAFIVDGQIPLIDAPRELKIREGERKVRVEYREDNQIENRDFSLDGIAVDEDFLKLLRSKRIETIHTEEATLEDVFIGTTGRKLI
jgi:fluoroquinolone transport system ATP-binding protein